MERRHEDDEQREEERVLALGVSGQANEQP